MRVVLALVLGALALLAGGAPQLRAADATKSAGLRIDIPVELAEARVVFNLDHLATATSRSGWSLSASWWSGSAQARRSGRSSRSSMDQTPTWLWRTRGTTGCANWTGGNPYKEQIAALQAAGVAVEMCAETMRLNGWSNTDLLPGIKVNSGANFRLVELIQQGFVEIQP